MTRDRAARDLETRILIDRPIEAVWKRVQDLARLADAIDGVQVRDASPTGDAVTLEGFVTVAPFRLRLRGHAAVLDADALTHRATVAVDLRDRDGRGRLTATARLALRPVGSGVEMVVHLDATAAGAIVRSTGDALFGKLDAFVRAVFVAIAGDAFAVEEEDTVDALFDLPVIDTDLDHEDVAEDADGADEDDLVDDEVSDDDLDPDDDLVLRSEPVADPIAEPVADPVIAAIVGSRVPASPPPTGSVASEPSSRATARPEAATLNSGDGRTVRHALGLPNASLPRRRGIGRFQNRAQRATQTAGTVAATAAVAAVVAGAFVARRWFGRR